MAVAELELTLGTLFYLSDIVVSGVNLQVIGPREGGHVADLEVVRVYKGEASIGQTLLLRGGDVLCWFEAPRFRSFLLFLRRDRPGDVPRLVRSGAFALQRGDALERSVVSISREQYLQPWYRGAARSFEKGLKRARQQAIDVQEALEDRDKQALISSLRDQPEPPEGDWRPIYWMPRHLPGDGLRYLLAHALVGNAVQGEIDEATLWALLTRQVAFNAGVPGDGWRVTWSAYGVFESFAVVGWLPMLWRALYAVSEPAQAPLWAEPSAPGTRRRLLWHVLSQCVQAITVEEGLTNQVFFVLRRGWFESTPRGEWPSLLTETLEASTEYLRVARARDEIEGALEVVEICARKRHFAEFEVPEQALEILRGLRVSPPHQPIAERVERALAEFEALGECVADA